MSGKWISINLLADITLVTEVGRNEGERTSKKMSPSSRSCMETVKNGLVWVTLPRQSVNITGHGAETEYNVFRNGAI